jgi:flagellar protein FliS
MPPPNAYLRTKVLTASPGELRLMLLEGAIRFARQGSEGLARRDYEAAYNGISRCQDILLELINALRPEHEPELCKGLSALYSFMYRRLVEGLGERDTAKVDEVIRLLEYERETWVLALQRLAEENGAPPVPPVPPAAPVPAGDGLGASSASHPGGTTISVCG